jgi:hypothetical protein
MSLSDEPRAGRRLYDVPLERVAALETQMAHLLVALANNDALMIRLEDRITKPQADHEGRLRHLERYAWLAIGGLAVLQAINYLPLLR